MCSKGKKKYESRLFPVKGNKGDMQLSNNWHSFAMIGVGSDIKPLGQTNTSHTCTALRASWVCSYISSLFPKFYPPSLSLTPPALSLKPFCLYSCCPLPLPPHSFCTEVFSSPCPALPLRSLLCFFSLIGLYTFGSDGLTNTKILLLKPMRLSSWNGSCGSIWMWICMCLSAARVTVEFW